MTVSQRASEIYKVSKISGGTWKQAMSQAYDEIARQNAEQEEDDARERIEDEAETIEEAYDGKADMLYDMNQLVAEIIIEAIDKKEETGVVYPATSILQQIEHKISWEYIEELVFWGSGDMRFDTRWRNSDGRISSEWKNAVDKLIMALNENISDLDNYDIVMAQFR